MKKLIKIGLIVPVMVLVALATVNVFADAQSGEVGRDLSGNLDDGDRSGTRSSDDGSSTEATAELDRGEAGERISATRRGRQLTRGRVVAVDAPVTQADLVIVNGSEASVKSEDSDKSGKSEVSPGATYPFN